MGYCTNCGAKLKENTKFCTGCGEKVLFSSREEGNRTEGYSDVISISNVEGATSNSFKNILLGFYVLLNIPLYAMSGGDDQMIGFLFYSLIITIVIAVRNRKENTFNWVLKILLVL